MGLIASYNLRSMIVRKGTAAMTAGGIAMVVAVFVMTLAIAQGFRATLIASGSPQNAIVLRKSATSETTSAVLRTDVPIIESLPQVARGADGRPLASPELVTIIALPRQSDNQPANVPARGVGPKAFEVRDTLKFVEGRRFTPGTREINVGKAGGRPLQGADARQRREVRQRDLESRRHLHRRRRVVRVGGLGRRRPDDAGVPAQRLPVDDREAGRPVDVRLVQAAVAGDPAHGSPAQREQDYYARSPGDDDR